jgi:hypothetical protein
MGQNINGQMKYTEISKEDIEKIEEDATNQM